MRRRHFFLSLAGLAGCTPRRRLRLNVFNWSNYTAPDTIPNFEAESGVSVRYATYESNEEMLAKVMSGNSGWDVAFPSNYFIGPMRQQGLLAPLRHALLTHVDKLEASFRRPAWDPQLDWSAPFMWGASGIACHRSAAPRPVAWRDLWSGRFRGRLTMLDDPAEVLGACLKKLGYSLNSTDPDQLRLAQREALAQKPLLRAYLNSEARDQLVAGDLAAAQAWTTTALQAMSAAPNLAFVYPEEGFALYADSAVVLKESRRADLAHAFMDYLLRPSVSAAIVAAAWTATASAGARALLPPGMRENPVLFPSPEILQRGEWFATLPPAAQRLRDRLWTEIKSA